MNDYPFPLTCPFTSIPNRIRRPIEVILSLVVFLACASPCLSRAEIPPVDPPEFLTTDNSANWEAGDLLYRYVGIGRTAQTLYMNGNIYAGGYGGSGSDYKSWYWSDWTDATSLVFDLDEDNGDKIDISSDHGTHGYHSRGGRLGPNVAYVSPGVNEADTPSNSNSEQSYGRQSDRPIPQVAKDGGDEQHYVYYPWAMPFNWAMYGAKKGYAWLWRMDELLGEWDAAGESGVVGTTMLIGNLFFVISDQNDTGVAVYDIGPLFDSDPQTGPVLLDKLSGSFGGYLNAVYENYLVLPTGTWEEWKLHLIDYSDPRNLRFAGEIVSELDVLQGGKNYVQFQDNYGFFQGNKVNMDTRDIELVMHGMDPANRPPGSPVNGEDTKLNTSQYNLPIGNLLLTGGNGGSGADGIGLWVHQKEPDTTKPYVGYHIPKANATNYPIGAPITVLIHETLEPYTIKYGETVLLKKASDGSLVDCHLSFSHDDLLTITPKEYLDVNEVYTVEVVDGGMKDAAGNGIEEYTFNFSTGTTEPNGNEPPEIVAVTVTGSPAEPGDTVGFTVDANDPDGSEILEYRFSPGDGGASSGWITGNSYNHVFSDPGHFETKIEVREEGSNADRSVELLTITVAPVLAGSTATHSAPIALDGANDLVWVVNPDNDSVTVFDSTIPAGGGTEIALSSVSSVAGPFDPRSVALDSSGNAWVACHDADRVIVLDSSGGLVSEIATGYGSSPAGVAASPDGASIFVTTQARGQDAAVLTAGGDPGNGQLLRYAAGSFTNTGSIELGPMARAIAVSGDGNRVFIGRFISNALHGEVWEVDASNSSSLGFTRTIELWPSYADASSANGPGVPNYISSLTIRPDGNELWYTGKKDNVLQGEFLGFSLQTDTTVRAIVGRIDLNSNRDNPEDRIDFDNADSPTGVAFSPRGDWAFVTAQGNNFIGVFDLLDIDASNDPSAKSARFRWATGLAPQGIVIDPVHTNLWTADFMDRTVTILPLNDFIGKGDIPLASAHEKVGSEALSASVLNGKQIFYNASGGSIGNNRMSDEGYISCATCHVDGAHDGQTFDFTQRGEGLRNTTDLRGRAGLGHGNVHWTANFDEIHDFNLDIVNHFGGQGFPAGTIPNDPLGAINDNGDGDLDDLVAYVTSLGTETLPKSPYRNFDGTMTGAALDPGATLFNGASMNCASCHDPSTDYTDSIVGDGTGALHDVGTLRNSSGSRLEGSLDGIDTPTLLGIWNTAPYLHNGMAPTLDDVFHIAQATSYQAEDATLGQGSGSIAPSIWDAADQDGKGALDGKSVAMRRETNSIEFSGIDGGSGTLASIEIRYSASRSQDISVDINGTQESIHFAKNREEDSEVTGWSTIVLERSLESGAGNSISLTKTDGNGDWFVVDEIAVSTDVDRDAASSHRRVLEDLNQTDYDAIIAYLRQLDGRDDSGFLPNAPFAEDGGLVVMEAENFMASNVRSDPNGEWTTQTTTLDDEVGVYVQAPTGSGVTGWSDGAELSYEINFATGGSYHIWVRRYYTSFWDNSLFWGVNGAQTGSNDNGGGYNSWTWVNLGSISISTGQQTFQLRRRETGARVDRFVLTTDSNYDPATVNGGQGPDESSRGSGGGTLIMASASDDSSFSVDEGSSSNTLDVLSNDSGTGIEITSVTSASYGTVTNNGGDLNYTPDAGVWGVSDTFDYTIEADDSSTDTATVTLSLNATDGTTLVPAAGLPLALQLGVGYAANRVLDSSGHWQLVSDGSGFDTSGTSDSTYMLADNTVSGDFQAYVQLVSLSGPSGSRMGLMLRDGDTTGAEFIAIGSDAGDGYTFQERDGSGGANAEVDATVGSAHSFPGKWVLLERVGNTVTVALDEDNTGSYTPETTVDISGWSDTLHVGLFVHSGAAGTNAVAEFGGYTVVPIAPTPGGGSISEVTGSFTEGLTSATVPTGDNRLLVFVAQSESAGVLNSVTYGGQSLTKAVDYTQGFNEVSIWYLDDAGITAASGTAFVPRWSGNENGEGYSSFFLTDVDQSAPLGETAAAGDPYTTANVDVATAALAVNAGDYSVFGVVRGSNAAAFNFSGGYAEQLHYSITSGDAAVATQAISADGSVTPMVSHASANYRIALAACVFNAAPGATGFQESGGLVVMEAENFMASDLRSDPNGEWTTQSAALDDEVGDYVQAPSGSGVSTWSDASELSYDINVTTGGTYHVWVRRYYTSGGDNSLFWGVDGTQGSGNDNSYSGFNQWYWVELGATSISSGEHTFQLRRRETDARVDRIILTTDSNYDPAAVNNGQGPDESPQN